MNKVTLSFAVAAVLVVLGLWLILVHIPVTQVPAEKVMSFVFGGLLCFGGVVLGRWAFIQEDAIETICIFIVGTVLMGIGFWAFSWITKDLDIVGQFFVLPIFSAIAGLLGAWMINRTLYDTEPESVFSDMVVIIALGVAVMVYAYGTAWAVPGYFWAARSLAAMISEFFPK